MKFVSKVMLEQLPAPGRRSDHELRRISARYDFLSGDQGHHRGAAHREERRAHPARCRVPGRSGRGANSAKCSKKTDSGASFLDLIKEAPVVVDQWQLEKLALVTQKAEILFYTPGVPGEYHKTLWGAIFSSPEDAVRALTKVLGPTPRSL